MVFQEATSEPAGKAKKPTACVLCLITNTWANGVAIVSFGFIRCLTLTNKGWSRFNLQICLCSVHHHILARLSAIVCEYYLSLIHSILFCFVQSTLFNNSVFGNWIIQSFQKSNIILPISQYQYPNIKTFFTSNINPWSDMYTNLWIHFLYGPMLIKKKWFQRKLTPWPARRPSLGCTEE
jgi:hypothetical protein